MTLQNQQIPQMGQITLERIFDIYILPFYIFLLKKFIPKMDQLNNENKKEAIEFVSISPSFISTEFCITEGIYKEPRNNLFCCHLKAQVSF